MGVGKFLCKIGLHKGEPVIADDESDEVEIQQTIFVQKKSIYQLATLMKESSHNPTKIVGVLIKCR